MSEAPLCEMACDLAEHGLRVFPVRPGAKKPQLSGWQKNASTNALEVEMAFSRYRHANIGVACGGPRRILVLDVDVKGDANGLATLAGLEKENCPLPVTWLSETPSGGRHYWFAMPEGAVPKNSVCFAPGLDTRGEGGLVVAPPSRLPNGCYKWLVSPAASPLAETPQWLVKAIGGGRSGSSGGPPLDMPPTGLAPAFALPLPTSMEDLQEELKRLFSSVANAPEGQGNITLFVVACRLRDFAKAGFFSLAPAKAFLSDAHSFWAQPDPGFDATVASAFRG